MTSPRLTPLRSGLAGGLIELRQAFSGTALAGQLLWPAATLIALFFFRHRELPGSRLTIGALMLPGTLGMFVAFGMMLMIQYLPADREDGTLLRARATPGGIGGYLTGKLATSSLSVLAYLAMIAVPGAFITGGLHLAGISWARLAWVLILGMTGTQLLGATLGALVPSPRSAGYVAFPLLGLTAVSGIFYPLTAMPGWLQGTAQAFPVYWLGLGMRSALLPSSAASVEIDGSWRTAQTAAVLGAWVLAGLVIAPVVLRRMTRRESGSRIAQRRDRSMTTALIPNGSWRLSPPRLPDTVKAARGCV
ncbi:MAG: ABC transporter permease [Nocardiopsaceae bacterium]|nr:ABC transporter permease [Nocardiopsaceae bacterium]